ncbi:ParB N-terminal domain-containing protein [Dermacoccus nishinomiyaensis]
MSTVESGHIELEWAVDSIRVGNRHRTDLGDLNPLIASIQRDGLLQPITITADGILVCGARRLAAIRQLGWKTVNVWVRSHISDRLGHLLAEQDDNVLHKPLTPLEAAALYRELKQLMAEDAQRRDAATRFSAENQPGSDGGAKFAPPSAGQPGKTREQAAAMIPGGASHTTLDKIGALERAATDVTLPETVREQITVELAGIEAGGPVDPAFQRARDLMAGAREEKDRNLDELARQALSRVKSQQASRGRKRPPAAPVRVWTVRSFVTIWGELDGWWTHYEPEVLAGDLTREQIDLFLTIADGTAQFAARLRTLTEHTDANSEDPSDEDEAGEEVRPVVALHAV